MATRMRFSCWTGVGSICMHGQIPFCIHAVSCCGFIVASLQEGMPYPVARTLCGSTPATRYFSYSGQLVASCGAAGCNRQQMLEARNSTACQHALNLIVSALRCFLQNERVWKKMLLGHHILN